MTRVSRLAVALSCLWLTAGCSVLNAPDRSGLVLSDGGVDSDVDSSMDSGMDSDVDSSMDSGMDSDVDTGPPPENCDTPGDEDMDGLADCDDFDCAGNEACCDSRNGENLVDEHWASLSTAWRVQPGPSGPTLGTMELTDFGGPDFMGLMQTRCEPLALGATIEVALTPTGTCASGGSAACEAGVVLTGATGIRPALGYLEDLGLRMTPSGHFTVTQAGRVLGSADFPTPARVDVTATISPDFDGAGHATLSVTVDARSSTPGADLMHVVTDESFVRQDFLSTRDACSASPGLSLAVQGVGDGVAVGHLSLSTRGCQNPGSFTRPLTGSTALIDIDRATEGMNDGSDTAGGIGAPSLFPVDPAVAGGDPEWNVYAEVTSLDPSLEQFTRVGWGIAATATASWTSVGFFDRNATSFPLLGSSPPGCIDAIGGCTPTDPSFREPFAVYPAAPGETTVRLLFAAQAPPETGHSIHGFVRGSVSAAAPLNPRSDPLVTPMGVMSAHQETLCDDLRDPALISPPDHGTWLLYTCRKNGVAPTIRAWRIQTSTFSVTGESILLLDASMLGSYARAGVSGPEPLVDYGADGAPLLRLWFMAHSRSGETSVALAQGVFKAGAPVDMFPVLSAYGANPVLRGSSPVLGCAGGCALSAFSAAREGATTVRMLAARRDASGYSLVPLQQALARGSAP